MHVIFILCFFLPLTLKMNFWAFSALFTSCFLHTAGGSTCSPLLLRKQKGDFLTALLLHLTYWHVSVLVSRAVCGILLEQFWYWMCSWSFRLLKKFRMVFKIEKCLLYCNDKPCMLCLSQVSCCQVKKRVWRMTLRGQRSPQDRSLVSWGEEYCYVGRLVNFSW